VNPVDVDADRGVEVVVLAVAGEVVDHAVDVFVVVVWVVAGFPRGRE